MKPIQIGIASLLVLALLIKPSFFAQFGRSYLGKLFFVLLIVALSLHDSLSGLLMLLIVVSFDQMYVVENMTSRRSSDSDYDDRQNIKNFKQKHCKSGELVDKQGNPVSAEDIGSQFPNVKFDSDKCNPCDFDCKFKLTSGKENMTVEEDLRPVDSKEYQPDRNAVSGSNTLEGFENLDDLNEEFEEFDNIHPTNMDPSH